MKKRMHWLLLMLVCCAIVLPGCRRKPIETETQTETQTETESETEKKTEKQTEKKSEKQTETNKRKTVSPDRFPYRPISSSDGQNFVPEPTRPP